MKGAPLKLLIDAKTIHHKVGEIARTLDVEYRGKDLVLVGVMKGAICLLADLLRALTIPCRIETLQCSSYQGQIRGELKIFGLERLQIENADVLLIDDIYDSGTTLNTLKKALQEKGAASVKTLALLEKKIARPHPQPDYALFQVDNLFVIGYGLDEDEYYRGLGGIYVKETP